jgi:stress-induced morphogen
MPIEKDKIAEQLTKAMPNAKFEIKSLIDDNNHYSLSITCPEFNGKNRIMQHRMVNEALKSCLGDELHALQINTYI